MVKMAFEKELLTTLRLHKSPITCIEPFYLPSDTFVEICGKNHRFLTTTLLTTDESGIIIWWNLITKRPLGIWKGHDESILTVKQLGIEWVNIDNSVISVIDENEFGKILTHSKDGTIKIWKLVELNDVGFTYTCVLPKRLSDIGERIPEVEFEMPVNMLNFTNVDINNQLLITPATVDSDGFDIYKLDLSQDEEWKKMQRLLQNVKFSLEGEGRSVTGVIMKIKWLNDTCFLIGYESGHVVCYEIIDGKTKETFINETLLGNPITCIHVDERNSKIIVSSTGNRVIILKYSGNIIDPSVISYDIKHKGIADIDVELKTGSVALITWDGYTRVYQYDEEFGLKFIFKTRRSIPSISNNINNDEDIQQNNSIQLQRASIVRFTANQLNVKEIENASSIIVKYSNGRSKNLIKTNRHDQISNRWMFIGHQDGKVFVYQIK